MLSSCLRYIRLQGNLSTSGDPPGAGTRRDVRGNPLNEASADEKAKRSIPLIAVRREKVATNKKILQSKSCQFYF